eukprot:gene11637-24368_t
MLNAYIPHYEDVVDGGEIRTLYCIIVEHCDRSVGWVLQRRYSDFERLYDKVRYHYLDVAMFSFPSKRIWNTFATSTKDRRLRRFSDLLNILLKIDPMPSELKDFLEVYTHQNNCIYIPEDEILNNLNCDILGGSLSFGNSNKCLIYDTEKKVDPKYNIISHTTSTALHDNITQKSTPVPTYDTCSSNTIRISSEVESSVLTTDIVSESVSTSPPTTTTTQTVISPPGFEMWCIPIDVVDVANTREWQILLSCVPIEERKKIASFRFDDDRKRAIFSALLQRSLIRKYFNIDDSQYEILRTKENKPYMTSKEFQIGRWNYNVSHHGKYVCIASHPNNQIGVDLVDISTRCQSIPTAKEYIAAFTDQQSTEELQYLHFYIHWSLKEAFVKAIGKGLSFDLQKAQFDITVQISEKDGDGEPVVSGVSTISLYGQRRQDWSLDRIHIMTVGIGPPVDGPGTHTFDPLPILQRMTIEDLIPESKLQQWQQIVCSRSVPLLPVPVS